MPDLMQAFYYEDRQIRTVLLDGEPWFTAADVCAVLELAGDPGQHLRRLDDDEKGLIPIQTPGGKQSVLAVNEPGLYALVLASRKTEAKLFKRWIIHEVLPTIRQTGAYSRQPVSQLDALRQTVGVLTEHEQRLAAVEATATTLRHRIDSLDAANIDGDRRQRLERMVRKYAWSRGILFAQAWREFDSAYNTAYHANLTAQRQNYAERNGLRHVTRPEYLAATDRLEDAIRVADKMLASARAAN